MKGYFGILKSVDLGYVAEATVRAYEELYNAITNTAPAYNNTSMFDVELYEGEKEAILNGFKCWCDQHGEGCHFGLDFAHGVRGVFVLNAYETASSFEWYTKEKLRRYYDYALPLWQEAEAAKSKKRRKTA